MIPSSNDKDRPLPSHPPTPPSGKETVFPAREVWDAYPLIQTAYPPFEGIRYPQLTSLLQGIHREHGDLLAISKVDATIEGRTIWAARIGTGPTNILVWARQHGDEPICTAAALNVLNYLASRPEDPAAREILEGATLLVLPMINPDGAQRLMRRNAMGIDPNRDARRGMTPEGAVLRRLKDEFAPTAAFNLHDMGSRRSTSTEHRLAALAFQACPYDEWGSDNSVRRRSKRLCARMAEASGWFAYGHLTRYETPYMPRSFGDSMIQWGAASCLIESGGWIGPEADSFVARLHYLALLAGLHAAASGSEASANASVYDSLPLNTGPGYFDIVIRNSMILDGSSRPRFMGDVGIVRERFDRRRPEGRQHAIGVIEDLGDLSGDYGKTEFEGRHLLLVPGLVAIAPGLRMVSPDSIHLLTPFLEAGFTSVIGGCGPFVDDEGFSQWKKAMFDLGYPVNFAAFEVVDSIDQVLARHGQTEAHGILVPELMVYPGDLLAALHLFHPAAHSALTEEQQEMKLSVDLMLRDEGAPRANRLHLLVRPLERTENQGESGAPLVSAMAIKELFAAFLRHPDQIGVTVDTRCRALGFFPTPPYIGGVGGGRVPSPNLLARTIATLQCSTADGLGMVVSRMTRQPAVSLGLMEIGLVRQGYLADLSLFDCGKFDVDDGPPLPTRVASPRYVIVNGELALTEGQPTGRNGGVLLLR